ncbi:MAG: PhnD/SsuA/transferrin family substrate-binding protein [Alphaproteobacteria bacterium]
MRFANLNLYLWPETRGAFLLLWQFLRARLTEAGIETSPEVAGEVATRALANDGALAVGQVCGIDVSHHSACYRTLGAFAGEDARLQPARYDSVLIAPADNPNIEAANLADGRAAINNPDSFSGSIALRAFVFGRSDGGRFEKMIVTGGHLASIQAIAEGRADFAAIDALCYGFASRFYPELVRRVRVIGHTKEMPAPPLVVGADLDGEIAASLTRAVHDFFATPEGARAMRDIGIVGFAEMPNSAYEPHRSV